ncbi:NAD(P)H-quinone oxidoreductase subunit N, chloroplastic [Vitis vinifera]|uniref:NAD(P)H-quinone oxidoreductase subunit N, chloroplastic n=1 Tax=Vitis vinifera TaxID=29760 RepID=A0A438KP51_VITVI|nr:NAD(P)H-quinone oxidoreductase subunit N, chloroplastic [Vitis vinifera]
MEAAACLQYKAPRVVVSPNRCVMMNRSLNMVIVKRRSSYSVVRCSGGGGGGIGIGDLGGYEGRYLNRLRYQGYYFLDLSARGLGDPETTLTEIHPVCPAHVGKQPIARWYFPPEVDYRLSLLPPNAKGLVVWIIEAKVLSKSELQFLALLPTLRPKVRVIAECGNWRKFMWKPLKEIAALTGNEDA